MREKFSFYIATNLITYGFNIITNYLLVSVLEVRLVGVIAFVTSLLGILALFLDLGLSQIYIQYNADDQFNDLFSIHIVLKTILFVSSYIPLIIFILFLGLEPLVLSYFILRFISNTITFFAAMFLLNLESRLKIFKRSIVVLATSIFKDSSTLYLIFNITSFNNPLVLLGQIYIFSSIIELIITLAFSKKEVKLKRMNMHLMRKYLKSTKPLALSSIITVILIYTGNILLDISFNHEVLAYYYVIDSYLITNLLLIGGQVTYLFSNYLPKEFKYNQLDNIQIMTHKIERYSSFIFLFITLFFLINGALLIKLFLPIYTDATFYLYLLIPIPYIASILRPYSSHIIASKREKILFKYNLYKGLIMLIAMFVIIPKRVFFLKTLGFGGFGLGIISLSSCLTDFFFFRYISYKIGIKSQKIILVHIILGIFSFLITWFLSSFFIRNLISNDMIFLFTLSLVLFGIYICLFAIFKQINRNDLNYLISLLKISTYKTSFSDEMKSSKA